MIFKRMGLYPPATPETVRAKQPRTPHRRIRGLVSLASFLLASTALAETALAGPALVIEMPSGAVLYEDHATQPWFPASVTKLMTVYVALNAVREHHITLDTPLLVSARAAAAAPSKMGFTPGTEVTLDNALKMLMVKSANDMAIVIAEGVSGSVEAFAEDMNSTAAALGLTQSHFVNPNGLPDPRHVSSARDLAILARALYLSFPEQAELFHIGAMRLGDDIIHNHNDLLGRYPGADGMKTGFTCAAGFNVVASATQGGRQLIAVVLGAPNPRSRMMMTAALFDRGFAGIDKPSKSLADLSAPTAMNSLAAPDLHQTVCGKKAKALAAFNTEVSRVMAPLMSAKNLPAKDMPAKDMPAKDMPAKDLPAKDLAAAASGSLALMSHEAVDRPAPVAPRICTVPRPSFDPVTVSVGAPAGYAGLIAQARPPHSPIGTPAPPEMVSAYTATDSQSSGDVASPLAPAPDALPLKNHGTPAKKIAAPAAKHSAARHKETPHKEKAAARTGKHAPQKAVHTKSPAHHGKTAPKLAAKPHPAAKSAIHAETAKSKKL